MRVSKFVWVSGLFLIASAATADPKMSVSDQQAICLSTAELLGVVRMEARIPADIEKMKQSRDYLDLMTNNLRAEIKLKATDIGLKNSMPSRAARAFSVKSIAMERSIPRSAFRWI